MSSSPLFCTCNPCHTKSYNPTQKLHHLHVDCLTHMMSLFIEFLHPSPNTTIRLKSNDLILITKSHVISIMDSWILMALSKFQPAMHILGREEWPLCALLMTQDLLHEVHSSLCWCSLPNSNAHPKHSSRLQHYPIHQLWCLLHTLVIEQGWCFLGALLFKASHENTPSTNPRARRLRDT